MLQTIFVSYLAVCYGAAVVIVLFGMLGMFTAHRFKELTWRIVAKTIGVVAAAPFTVPAVVLFFLAVSMIDFRQSGN